MNERLKALKEAAINQPHNSNPIILPDFVLGEVSVKPNLSLSTLFGDSRLGSLARAWKIPSLMESLFVADDEYSLLKLIINKVNTYQIRKDHIEAPLRKDGVLDIRIGELRKYWHLHAIFTSDIYSSEYGTPMYMDLYGRITKFGERRIDEINRRPIRDAKDIGVPIEFQIYGAYWSNVGNPIGYRFL